MVAPLSGKWWERRSPDILRGIYSLKLYERWINKCIGGIEVGDGRLNIQTIILNDRSNKTYSLSRVMQLIEDHEVDFIFTSPVSSMARASLAYTEEKKIVTISGACEPQYTYCFDTSTSDTAMFDPIITALALRGARGISYLWNRPDDLVSNDCAGIDAVVSDLPHKLQDSVEVVYANYSDHGDYTEVLTHMKHSLQRAGKYEDLDLIIGCIRDCEIFINDTKNLGIDFEAMVFISCIGTDEFNQIGEDGKYVLGPTAWEPSFDYECDVTGISAQTFHDTYVQLFDQEPEALGASSFAGLLALGESIKNAGTEDSDSVRFALSRLDIDTMYGPVRFNAENKMEAEKVFKQIDENLNSQIVIPDAVATDSLIYPMPVWTYRLCALKYGEDHCMCSEEGCPACTVADFVYNITQCQVSSESRSLRFYKSPTTDCQGGESHVENYEEQCDFVPLGSKTGIIIIALSVLTSFVALIYFGWVVFNFNEPVIQKAQPGFCLIFLGSGCILALSQLLLLGKADPVLCVVRVWAFHLPFTGMVGSLFVKVYRVWKIFEGAKSLRKFRVTFWKMLRAILGMLLVDVIILVCQLIFMPPSLQLRMEHIPNVGDIPFLECSRSSIFSTILITYKVSMVLIGCYFSFQIRSVHSEYSETKFIMFALYSVAIVMGISTIVAIQGVSVKLSVLMEVFGVTISTLIAITCVILPKIVLKHHSFDGRANTVINVHNSNDSNLTNMNASTGQGITASNEALISSYQIRLKQLEEQICHLQSENQRLQHTEKNEDTITTCL